MLHISGIQIKICLKIMSHYLILKKAGKNLKMIGIEFYIEL